MEPQEVVYVYPDIAFAVSFLMNTLILWGTARINRLAAGWSRIAAGAAFGALYSFAAAFPRLSFLHYFWFKVPVSVVILAVTFVPLSLKRFASSLVVFYITSFSLGGMFLGILYFFQSSGLYLEFSNISRLVADYFFPGISLTVFIYILFTRYAGQILQKRLVQNLFRVPVKVLFGESEVRVEALIDTGNQLHDPLSHKPVMVMEYSALKSLFPQEVQSAFEKGGDPDLMLVLDSLSQTTWFTRFRVIPFTSLGRENGLLIGFRPDRVEVYNGGSLVCTRNVIVGVYHQELSPEGTYRALLHPDVLEGITA